MAAGLHSNLNSGQGEIPMTSTATIQSLSIGDVHITKVLDCLEPTSPRILYVDKQRNDFDPHLEWLQPHFLDAEKRLLLSIHAFIIQTAHHMVLIDTCVGNHKEGLGFPQWNGRNGTFLQDVATAGYAPESIDYVFCTHMHLDHTGWNTRQQDGRWVPTFPKAKYLFNQ